MNKWTYPGMTPQQAAEYEVQRATTATGEQRNILLLAIANDLEFVPQDDVTVSITARIVENNEHGAPPTET